MELQEGDPRLDAQTESDERCTFWWFWQEGIIHFQWEKIPTLQQITQIIIELS